jgi:glycosidase
MFQDVVKNGKRSKYYDFYIVHGDKPDKEKRNYETFGSVAMMPKLNSSDYLENDYFVSVGKYFIEKFSIDGFRLDVANEVSHTFPGTLQIRTEKDQKGCDTDR